MRWNFWMRSLSLYILLIIPKIMQKQKFDDIVFHKNNPEHNRTQQKY